MAYAAVTSLIGTLHLHFLQSQPRFPLEHKQEIVSVHENLGFLREMLEKSEIAYDNAAMKDLEAEIRDVLFRAEERIEMELSTIYLQSSSIEACLLRLHGIFNQAVKQTDYLKKKLIKSEKQLAKGSSITGVSLLGRMRRRGLLLGSTSSQPDLQRENIPVSKFSKNASKLDSRMVGCKEEFKKIMDQLTQQSVKQRQVVSIVGMGGIGKTTLACKVYEDPSIISHFDMRARVSVSQEYNVEQLLQCLIGCVTAASSDELPEPEPEPQLPKQSNVLHEQRNDNFAERPRKHLKDEQRNDNLAERLRKHLKDQRYLIVMDDIWSTSAWDSVHRCFPDDNNGSRILLTSRLREVAEYATSSGNSVIDMPFLDANESWNLFCNVFGKTECLLEFEQIGRGIVKKCNGLPLAITVVASLLSKTEEDVEKWKNFAENVSRFVIGDSSEACSRILYLSYNQLPHHLKGCFLYFGVFPEDYEIPVKKLIRLWAAEGFLRVVKHLDLEEVGMQCLQDLVDRSLVLVSQRSYNGKLKTIRLHDLLRDLCLREARRENLIGLEKLSFYKRISHHQISKPCRWISDRSRSFNNQISKMSDKCFHKLHSLHCFHYNHFSIAFSHFRLLRVVDMKIGINGGYNTLNGFENLVHLRYLVLSTKSAFPVKLFEHWNMQSFMVRGRGVTLDFSESFRIWKMPLLRNFYVDRILSLETPSVVCRHLESISWLDPKLCSRNLFTRIPNLKKLGIDVGFSHTNMQNCFYNFVHLEQLEKLSIREWLNIIHIPCTGILWGTSFLPNLKKLNLIKTNLPWSDMRLIGMLPNLEVLKLIDGCTGNKWELLGSGFCQLKRLVIADTYLECWNVIGDNFGMLECLELHDCHYLPAIPSDFAEIITLVVIQLNNCWDSLLASAKLIQVEQQNNYGNDALRVHSENIKTRGKESLHEAVNYWRGLDLPWWRRGKESLHEAVKFRRGFDTPVVERQ